jgi:hypothetical protein
MLPLLPFVCVYAAGFACVSINYCSRVRRWLGPVAAIAVGLGFLPILWDSAVFGIDHSRPDTRTIAKTWIEDHISQGSEIYISGGIIAPSTMTAPLNIAPELVDPLIAEATGGERGPVAKSIYYELFKQSLRSKTTYRLILMENRVQLGKALACSAGEYAVLHAESSSLFEHERNRTAFPLQYRLIKWIESGDFQLIRRFEAGPRSWGPTLLVYRRNREEDAG